MATTLQTHYSEVKAQEEADNKKLRKMKSVEHDKMLFGWRYVKIDSRTTLLVPCDKNGEPTEEGKRKIEAYKDI